jgi:hypothetical protein
MKAPDVWYAGLDMGMIISLVPDTEGIRSRQRMARKDKARKADLPL